MVFIGFFAVSLCLPGFAHAADKDVFDNIASWFQSSDPAAPQTTTEISVTTVTDNAGDTPADAPDYADLVVLHKKERKLELWNDGKVFRTYPVALGFTPIGAKHQEGDGKTPEGIYLLTNRNEASNYHLSILVDYPSGGDMVYAESHRVNPGGKIMIHGLPNDGRDVNHPKRDWTDGCIAVTNAEIEEIWQATQPNTPIMILP